MALVAGEPRALAGRARAPSARGRRRRARLAPVDELELGPLVLDVALSAVAVLGARGGPCRRRCASRAARGTPGTSLAATPSFASWQSRQRELPSSLAWARLSGPGEIWARAAVPIASNESVSQSARAGGAVTARSAHA